MSLVVSHTRQVISKVISALSVFMANKAQEILYPLFIKKTTYNT